MKRTQLFLALFLLLSLVISLSACSSASYTGSSSDMNFAPAGNSSPMASAGVTPMEKPEYNGIMDADYPSSGGGTYYENTKVILTAELILQSTDFDGALEALDALVSAQNGYYEDSNYNYGSYYSSGNRWGEFTVRVPRENYQTFLAAAGELAHLISRNTSTQDVGEAYYDAELHLATLNTKHDRLLVLLDKAELMEDIIALESALSEVEYQIQQYTSTLTRYDGLIDFATIHISLQEVVRVTESVTEKDSLGVRLGSALSQGWNNFCDGMADFIVWLAYNLIGVIVFLVIVTVVILLLLRWRKKRRLRYKGQPPVE